MLHSFEDLHSSPGHIYIYSDIHLTSIPKNGDVNTYLTNIPKIVTPIYYVRYPMFNLHLFEYRNSPPMMQYFTKQGPRFIIRMVIGIFCSDTVFVQLNQYSQILRRQCCLLQCLLIIFLSPPIQQPTVCHDSQTQEWRWIIYGL